MHTERVEPDHDSTRQQAETAKQEQLQIAKGKKSYKLHSQAETNQLRASPTQKAKTRGSW